MTEALKSFLTSYSACEVCRLNLTDKCRQSVPYLSRAVFFTTPYKNFPNDDVTFYCPNFKLNKSALERKTQIKIRK